MQIVWVTYTAYGNIISQQETPPEEGFFSVGPFKDFWAASRFIDWQEAAERN